MTKQIKKETTRKATVTKKVVAKKSNRKEETKMNININDTLEKIRYNIINSNIININKKYHKALPTYTMEEIYDYINTQKNPEEIIKALTIITVLKEKLVTKSYNEYKLNREYGKEEVHPSELQPDTSKKKEHEDRLQSEFDTMKKEIAKLNKVITKALKEKEQA